MDLWERLERDMEELEGKIVELKAEPIPLYSQIAAWVFALCLVVVTVASTVWFVMWLF